MREKRECLKFSIIILNYNGWRDTIECLESIQKLSYLNYEVIVVDNGSTDCSIEMISEWARNNLINPEQLNSINGESTKSYSKDIREVRSLGKVNEEGQIFLVEAAENKGFACGNNIGIRFALRNGSPDFVCLLNNDAIVLNKEIFHCLTKYFSQLKNIGVITPLVYNVNGEIQKSIARKSPSLVKDLLVYSNIGIFLNKIGLSRIIDSWYYVKISKNLLNPLEVYAISGACMFFSSDVIKKIGFLDENTFLYYEEYIVAEKLRELGLHSYVVPCNGIFHKKGKTVKKHFLISMKSEIRSYNYFYKVYRHNCSLAVNFFSILRFIDRSILYLLVCLRDLLRNALSQKTYMQKGGK